eukprot:757490-Hanusia_phi.AAC.5
MSLCCRSGSTKFDHGVYRGSNEYGQASAPGLTIGQKYVRLSCGMAYSCALRVDQAGIEDGIGFLVCFGNYSGYINPKDGAIIRERSSIAVGQSHACITDAVDGLVSCWQGDFASQLPDGITVVPAVSSVSEGIES